MCADIELAFRIQGFVRGVGQVNSVVAAERLANSSAWAQLTRSDAAPGYSMMPRWSHQPPRARCDLR